MTENTNTDTDSTEQFDLYCAACYKPTNREVTEEFPDSPCPDITFPLCEACDTDEMVRELQEKVDEWRDDIVIAGGGRAVQGENQALSRCASEVESILERYSGTDNSDS